LTVAARTRDIPAVSGADGDLYAVQIADAGLASGPPIGSLRRVDPDGTNHTPIAGGLFAPYGIAVHGDAAYVSVCAVCPDDGAVIQVPLG
jgi:hypothetical protein